MKYLKSVVIAVLIALYGTYFLHLAADRPGVMRWVDSSIYTDEGWYGAAALHSAMEHQWYLPHSFNPSLLVPGWPVLLRFWFVLSGPGMVATRVLALLLFGISLYCTWRLLNQAAGWTTASIGIALLLVNPYVYAFERLALLEPLVIVCTTLGLWIALRKPIVRKGDAVLRGFLVGVLLVYGVLGKTTAVAFLPSLLLSLYAVSFCDYGDWWRHFEGRRLLAPASAFVSACMLWLAYFFLLVRPYPYRLESFRAVYRINATHINLSRLGSSLVLSTWFARQTGEVLFLFAFLALVASFFGLKTLWRSPLFVATVLNFSGTLFLFGYRSWFIPRYYQLCLIPTVILVVMGLHALWQRSRESSVYRVSAQATAIVIAIAGILMARTTLGYLLHPTYTFRDSANAIAQTMREDTSVPPVLLAASGEDLSLWTGIRQWNPIWPLHGLQAILDVGHPGWYAVYVPQGPMSYPELDRSYNLVETGRYSIMPSNMQRQLVLFKLVPRTTDVTEKNNVCAPPSCTPEKFRGEGPGR